MKFLSNLIHRIVLFSAYIIVKIFFPFKVIGKDNIPKKGPFLLYSNHMSAWDPVILAVLLAPKKAYFMAKKELFKGKFMNWFMHALAAFPVDRDSADINAIKSSISHLKNNDIMIIFPEGTRNPNKDGSVQRFFNGVGIIAMQTNCDLIPAYIDCVGGYKLFKRFRIVINKSINAKKYTKKETRKETLNRCVSDMRKAIIDLV